jgi:mono/diheme cytochrome c family protein
MTFHPTRALAPLAIAAVGSLMAAGSALRAEAGAPAQSETREAGRELFNRAGCAQCHTLADAEAVGSYAPSLDANPHLTRQLVLDRLTHGQGDMPSFAGILSSEEIATLAAYVIEAAEPAQPSGPQRPSRD